MTAKKPPKLISRATYADYCATCNDYYNGATTLKVEGKLICTKCLLKAIDKGEYTFTKGGPSEVEAAPVLSPLDQGVPIEVDWGEE